MVPCRHTHNAGSDLICVTRTLPPPPRPADASVSFIAPLWPNAVNRLNYTPCLHADQHYTRHFPIFISQRSLQIRLRNTRRFRIKEECDRRFHITTEDFSMYYARGPFENDLDLHRGNFGNAKGHPNRYFAYFPSVSPQRDISASHTYICGANQQWYLDTGFSWFSWVLEQMLGWFPSFLSIAITCLPCSPPKLNLE
jgi:hypothetical protein